MTKQIDRQTELQNITFIKCILMFCVVLGHSLVFWRGGWFTALTPAETLPILGGLSSYFSSFPIYGFVLASGYLYSYIRFEQGGYAKFWRFLKNKALRLLVPYLFALLIWVLPIMQFFFQYSSNELFHRLILAESPGQLWFLPMLFFVFLFVWPLSKLFQKHLIIGIATVLFAYAAWIVVPIPNVFQIMRALSFLPFFWIGMQFRLRPCKLIKRIHPLIYFIAHLILFFASNLIPKDGFFLKLLHYGLVFSVHIAGAVMAFSLLQWLGSIVNWKENKFFVFFSIRSMPIYLFHQQVIYFVLYLLNGKLNPYLIAPICFLCAVGFSTGISSLLLLWEPTRILLGEKPKKVAT